ncbi:SDR family oxidoreductase [Actinomycetes bacterium KLBMP 9759]
MFGLDGRTAVVTGARTGLGRAIALGLADAGADLVLWGRTSDGLADVAREVERRGRGADVVAGDLADHDAVRETAAGLAANRRVDVLVNNAGTIRRADALDTAWDDWRHVLDVNLDAAFALSQELGRGMVARGDGRIVNIASLLSFQGGIRVPAYAAAKHALAGLTRALSNEWAGRGVNVNAVAPGYIATDNTSDLRADPEREPAIRARIPAGRWGEATDVVGAVVFLCSPSAAYVHGHVLAVDGGWLGR